MLVTESMSCVGNHVGAVLGVSHIGRQATGDGSTAMMPDPHIHTVPASAMLQPFRLRLKPTSPTPVQSAGPAGHGQAPWDLVSMVDEMEERIVAERQAAGVAGNARERAEVPCIEGEDQAPD